MQVGILGITAMLFSITATAPFAGAVNLAGSLDPSFGQGGKELLHLGMSGVPSDAVALANGDIVISGDFGLARVLPGGALDPTFGQGGVAALGAGSANGGHIAQTAEGGFVVAATTSTASGAGFAVTRVSGNGSVVQSFGSGGTATLAFITDSGFFTTTAVLVQPYGKIVAVGYSEDNSTGQTSLALARFLAQ
jgi:hypothetical protein